MTGLTGMGELPSITVDEMEGFIHQQVSRLIEGKRREELLIFERNSTGGVVIRDRQVLVGSSFRNVRADALEEAAKRVIKTLVVEPGRISERKRRTPSGRNALIIKTTKYDVGPGVVLVREEVFKDGLPRGMSVALRRERGGLLRRAFSRLFGR